MGAPGADLCLSEAASKRFPFAVECKNQESLQIWKALEQAEANRKELMPLLVFKRNRSDLYCALRFDDLIKIIRRLEHAKNLLQTHIEDEAGESL